MRDLKMRLFVSCFALAITLFSIYFATNPYFQPFFTLLLSCVIGIALWEYYQIAKTKGHTPPVNLAIFCSTLYTFAVYFSTQFEKAASLPQLALLISLILLFAYFFWHIKDSFITLAITVFGFAYLAMTLATALNITFDYGRYYLLFAIIVTKMTDTGAYFCGKRFGRHKLAPFISPNKTWEGAVGGVAAALITGAILTAIPHGPPALPLLASLFLSFLIGIFAQFGDLTESILKRDAGVKDSNQLPGLGGILDMVDSLVFTIPLIYLFLREML